MDDLREKLCSAILEAGNIGDADSYRYKMADAALAVFKEWLVSDEGVNLIKYVMRKVALEMLAKDTDT